MTDAEAKKEARKILQERAEAKFKEIIKEVKARLATEQYLYYGSRCWNEELKELRQLLEDAHMGPRRLYEISQILKSLACQCEHKYKGTRLVHPLREPLSIASEKLLVLAAK